MHLGNTLISAHCLFCDFQSSHKHLHAGTRSLGQSESMFLGHSHIWLRINSSLWTESCVGKAKQDVKPDF